MMQQVLRYQRERRGCTIAKADIKEITQDKNKSIMPEELIEAMTLKDYQDVLGHLW